MDPDRDEAALDALRRRLYGPEATAEDLDRYLANRPEPATTAAPEEPAGSGASGASGTLAAARPRRRRAPLLLGVLALTAALVPAALLARPGARTPAPGASPIAVRMEDVGEGRVLRVVTGAVGGSSTARVSVRGVLVEGLRVTGTGSAVVPVPRRAGFGDGGRMRVILTAPGAVARWRALLVVHGDDRTSYPLVVARGLADGTSSAGASGTFVYAADPPTRVAVEAPPGARWTMVVAVRPGLQQSG